MKLQRLFLSNFLSFEKISIVLEHRGLLLVSGKNGSGKSSLFSKALSWGLFGQTPDGLKGDSLIRNGEDKAEIELNLQGLTIIRNRPHALRFLTDSCKDYIEYRNATEAQTFIDNYIQRDFTTFINADYFGQGRKSNFINEPAKVQLEILEEILGLTKLDAVIDLTKKHITKWTEVVDHAKITAFRYQTEFDSYIEQKINLSKKLKDLTDKLEGRQQLLKNQETKRAAETMKVTVISPSIVAETIESRKNIIKNLETKLSVMNAEIKSTLDQIVTLKAQRKTIKDELCPTCDQVVNISLTEQLKKNQELIELALSEKQATLEAKTANKNNILSELPALKNQLNNAIIDLNKLNVINIDYDIVIKNIKDDISDLSSKISLINEQITKVQYDIAQCADWLESSLQDQKINESNLQRVRFWHGVFTKDFKNFVIRETLPFIEERTRYHLGLLNNSHIDIKFSTIKELKSGEERSLFNLNFKVKNGGSEYSSLSGGEKQIASFAIGLTLSELVDMQNGEPSNVMILDEPFTELDGPNCENVINYLNQELLKKKETIILISNDDRMKSLVTNVIEIEKDENGISKINE